MASKRRNGLICIIIAIIMIIGVVGAFVLLRGGLLGGLLGGSQATEPLPVPTESPVKIAIVVQPLQRGTMITEEMIKMVSYPRSELVEGLFIIDSKEAVGKRLKQSVAAQMPLTTNMITDEMVGSAASFEIPVGSVAIAVPISRLTSVAFAPQSGDHVNLIASLAFVDMDKDFQTRLPNFTARVSLPGPGAEGEPASASSSVVSGGETSIQGRGEMDPALNQPLYLLPSEAQRSRAVSQTIIQNAIVLRMGSFAKAEEQQGGLVPTPTPTPGPNGQPAPEVVSSDPDIITLIVSPQDAHKLTYLMLHNAKLGLALRNPTDNEKVKLEAVTLQFLMDQYNIPLPAKQPYGIEPRIDKLEYPRLNNDPFLPSSPQQ